MKKSILKRNKETVVIAPAIQKANQVTDDIARQFNQSKMVYLRINNLLNGADKNDVIVALGDDAAEVQTIMTKWATFLENVEVGSTTAPVRPGQNGPNKNKNKV